VACNSNNVEAIDWLDRSLEHARREGMAGAERLLEAVREEILLEIELSEEVGLGA
jgi:hypothetical protein